MSLQDAIPGYTPAQWATAFLQALKVPVNPQNVDAVVRWENGESGGYNPHSPGGKYNPLNTVTQAGFPNAGQGGAQGDIADYATFAQGIAATAHLFSTNTNARPILDAFRANPPNENAIFAAINQFYGSWGGSFTPGGAPAETTSGTAATGGTTSAATTSASSTGGGCPDGNLVTMPGSIPNITRCMGRAMLGAAALAGGALLLLAGAVLLGVGSNAGRQTLQTVTGGRLG